MTFSLLQLNIWGDRYWDTLIPFLKTHDFDIINLQEVAGMSTAVGNLSSKRDCFKELTNLLSSTHKGELAVGESFTSSPFSYDGNAIFYKKDFSLIEKQHVTLHKATHPFPSSAANYEDIGRSLLHVKLNVSGTQISFLNAHFGWAKQPIEHPHQTRQGEILLDFLRTVSEPFVLSGDFNLLPNQPIIQKLSQLSQNLITKYHITNTLNPRTHSVKHLFPEGLAVDYIFPSKNLTVKDFEVLKDEDLSDHFGLTATIEI